MSVKKTTSVYINKRKYTISGYEDEEYLQSVASYINKKSDEIEKLENFSRLSADMKAVLLNINLCNDFFKARERVEDDKSELEQKDQEIYDLKNELVAKQVNAEKSENEIKELKKEVEELKLAKKKLESTLEDALLGSTNSKDEDNQ